MTTMRHLNERQKTVELLIMLYCTGLGVFIGASISFRRVFDPLSDRWPDMVQLHLPVGQQMALAYFLAVAGVTQALGISLNGGWRWSPLLRFLGVIVHTASIIIVWLHVGVFTITYFTMIWLVLVLVVSVIVTFRDVLKALRGTYGSTYA